jgi:nitrite reductase/ring-hydroxylating ferredoxin subunit/uncharacterized membrane protein
MGNVVEAILDAQRGWAEPLGGLIQRILKAIFAPLYAVKDFLNGTWLGHALHPALTDVPVGAFTAALVLDIANIRSGADLAITLGILGMLAAAVTGWADYTDTDGKARDHGTVHMVVMVTALVLYIVSLGMRRAGDVDTANRALPLAISVVAYLLVVFGAYIGGHIVFALGNMVDRHAWRAGGAKWSALDVASVPEGQPTKARAGAQTLVVVRRGERVYALHDTCAHAGCSLSEGKLVDDIIECKCHGSRYRLADGRSVRGPAVYDQPSYETRAMQGRIEVRRAGTSENQAGS